MSAPMDTNNSNSDSDSDSSFCEIIATPTTTRKIKGRQVQETPPTQLRRRIRILQKENEQKHQLGVSLGAAATKAKGEFQAQKERAEKAEAACEAQKKSSRLQVPWFWEEGGDGAEGREIKLVEVKRDTEEWTAVAKTFLKTLGSSVVVDLEDIPHIRRIQNPYLWQSYQAKAMAIQERALREGVSERRRKGYERHGLWHGTDHNTIDKVVTQGFNRSFAGRNATMWGKGVYFATTSGYSHRYASVNTYDGTQLMLLCSVLVGEYCLGVRDAKVPNERDTTSHLLYDSTTDNMADARRQMYVTYNDAQAYAHYQIEYRLISRIPAHYDPLATQGRMTRSGLLTRGRLTIAQRHALQVLANPPWPAPPSTRLRPSVVLRKQQFDIAVVPASSSASLAAAAAPAGGSNMSHNKPPAAAKVTHVAPSLAVKNNTAAMPATSVGGRSTYSTSNIKYTPSKKKIAAPWPIIICLGTIFLGILGGVGMKLQRGLTMHEWTGQQQQQQQQKGRPDCELNSNCPSSAAECEAAADIAWLGLAKISWVNSASFGTAFPAGCFLKYENGNAHFNTDSSSTAECSPDLRCLCNDGELVDYGTSATSCLLAPAPTNTAPPMESIPDAIADLVPTAMFYAARVCRVVVAAVAVVAVAVVLAAMVAVAVKKYRT